MSTSDRNGLPNYDPVEGASELENRLRRLYAEQLRLQVLLAQTRTELDRVSSEVMRFQQEYCTDEAREKEYEGCIERIFGFSERDLLAEIEQANKDPQSVEDFLAELQQLGQGLPEKADG
jgi:predicted  nucleic acid-binding Zn-ribbon protein